MVNRVVLGAFDNTFGLRASRPTFDVLSTALTPEQIAFDSRWARAANIYASGVTRGTLFWADMQASIYCNIQCLAGLPYPPVVKSLLRHESRNEFCHGEFLQAFGTTSYNASTGVYNLSGGPPWTISNPVNGMAWGYFYWIALRSD